MDTLIPIDNDQGGGISSAENVVYDDFLRLGFVDESAQRSHSMSTPRKRIRQVPSSSQDNFVSPSSSGAALK
jgi:hypothetical protein